MELREFGRRCGFRVPRANIGSMRLPRDTGDAISLVRRAIDAGMRYIDTSRGYGEAEWVLGRALKDGYRERVILSTKWAPWITKIQNSDDSSAGTVQRRIEEQMKRLDVDYLDFYQVWNIESREHFDEAVRPGGMVEGILKAKERGLIGHTGFTSHDTVANLLDYVRTSDWCEILLLSYNLMNQTYAPVLEAAHRQGIGTIVMNPVGGGRMGESSPLLAKLAEEVGAESVPDLALRYVLSNADVDTVISGISKPSDVEDTIRSVARGPFDADAMQRVEAFLARQNRNKSAFCTACGYCMPCPRGIDIPAVMACLYESCEWGLHEASRRRYRGMKTAKADACTRCGQCLSKCTQHLDIPGRMAEADRMFGEAARTAQGG